MDTVLRWLVYGLLAYGAFVLIVYFIQASLIFFPTHSLRATPADIGLAYTDVILSTPDGVTLHGWWVPTTDPQGTVLFFHGNAGNVADRVEYLTIWHDLGWNVLILDYRGYGKSTGRPDEAGLYRDAETAWRYLTRERAIPDTSIVILGRSLGGAVAAYLAARVRPRALILDSAFTSLPALAQQLYPWLPARWLVRFRFPTVTYLQQVRCPVLIIHSVDDEIVPFRHAETLWRVAPEPKQLLRLRGGHNTAVWVSESAYRTGLAAFLQRLPKPPSFSRRSI